MGGVLPKLIEDGLESQIVQTEIDMRGKERRRDVEADGEHPGSAGGFDPGDAIFHHRDLRRGQAERSGDPHENIGRGLGSTDGCSVGDGVKAIQQMNQPQHQPGMGAGRRQPDFQTPRFGRVQQINRR